jgi:amino acid adenylation domain-containing protein
MPSSLISTMMRNAPDVVSVLRSQAAGNGDRPALLCGTSAVTYRQADQFTDRAAEGISSLGAGPGTLLGLAFTSSRDFALAALAVLKAGAAFVPLDPGYPRERLAYMAADSGLGHVITQADLAGDHRFPAGGPGVHLLPDLAAGQARPAGGLSVTVDHRPGETAYLIYTSGTTGRPKGVRVTRGGLAHMAAALTEGYGVRADDRVLQFSSISFDSCIAEIVMSLTAGATLICPEQSSREEITADLHRILRETGTTVVTLPPSLLRELPAAGLEHLRTVISAGERCDRAVVTRWAGGRRLINAYGPTEATIGASYHHCDPGEEAPPIGLPFPGVIVRVLDGDLREAGEGRPGELYIGGPGLAQGYHGQPARTAARFVPDPHPGPAGGRLYATGDRARWHAGRLEYLGRVDRQVKIRGYRVEPAEVERALEQHPAVAAAAVTRWDAADALIAYVVPADQGALDPVAVRDWLSALLPAHLVPARLLTLARLPLTVVGKVDYGALPVPGRPPAPGGLPAAGLPVGDLATALADLLAGLLGLDSIAPDQDFFELGMHSLLAVRLANRARQIVGRKVPVSTVFEARTLRELAAALTAIADPGAAAPEPDDSAPAAAGDRPQRIPASHAQERIWIQCQREAGNAAYTSTVIARIRGPLVPGLLQEAFTEIVARHEALRTTFGMDAHGVVQIVHREAKADVEIMDMPGLAAGERGQAIGELAAGPGEPFALDRLPLLRARLVRFSADDHALLVAMHHIISDGWSTAILARELGECYRARLAGREPALAPLALQYPDVALWERRASTAGRAAELEWWRSELGDPPPVATMPADRPRPPLRSYRGSRVPIRIDGALAEAVNATARRHDATVFMVLLTSLAATLSRYCGQDSLTIGTVLANRARPAFEDLIGCFVNPMPIRCDLIGDPSFATALGRVRGRMLGAYSHQQVPFGEVAEELGVHRGDDNPLLQVMLVLQNMPVLSIQLDEAGLTIEVTEAEPGTAKFDLLFTLAADDGALAGTLEYDTDLYDRATAQRLVRHWLALLRAATAGPSRRLSAMPLASGEEQEELLRRGGRRPGTPRDDCLPRLFAEQVRLHPDAPAVSDGERRLSYAGLSRRSCAIASLLAAHGVRPGDIVGVRIGRSADLIAGLLAILRCGAAYLPLDPRHPEARQAYCLDDAGATLIVHDGGAVPGFAGRRLVSVTDAGQCGHTGPCDEPGPAGPGDLAYVIYTSGSTGAPKGVAVGHGSVTSLLAAAVPLAGGGPGEVWSMFHSAAFDFSVWEIWGALGYGGRVTVVPADAVRAPGKLIRLLRREGVTVLSLTPSAFQGVADEAARLGWPAMPSLRHLVFGGEALDPRGLAAWFAAYGDERPQVTNMYGITETCVHVTSRRITAADAGDSASLIGGPLPHLSLRVLDGAGQLAPVGVPGELHVGGDGLARGYLARGGLTAGRFVPDPYGPAGARLYRTGDRARWRPDGELEYLGRLDRQVQVHGYRVELGEIEAALLGVTGVGQAIAVAGPGHRVTAHLSGEPGLDPKTVRERLAGLLPHYMIPAQILIHPRLPLTANGKVDARALAALPEPDGEHGRPLAAATPRQRLLAQVWTDVLGRRPRSITDSFFDLGGDSIGIIRTCALAAEHGLHIDVEQFYLTPTIEALAARADEAAVPGAGACEPLALLSPADRAAVPPGVTDAYPLSGMQQAMLYHSLRGNSSALFHNVSSGHLRLPFDEGAFREAVAGLIAAHPVLRTAFRPASGGLIQVVHAHVPVPLAVHDIRDLAEASQQAQIDAFLAAEKGTPFDTGCPPLVRLTVHRRSDDTVQLTVTEHHAILDGWSVASMLVELFQRYAFTAGLSERRPPPPPSATFKAFIAAERAVIEDPRTREFWDGLLTGARPCLIAPVRSPLPGTRSRPVASSREVPLTPATSARLHAVARREAVPVRTVLLAAHIAALAAHLDRGHLITGVVEGCRLPAADGDRVLGMFLNTVPLPAATSTPDGWAGLIAAVAAAQSRMRPHVRYPLPEIQRGRPALFDSAFNFTHFHVYERLRDHPYLEVLSRSEFQRTDLALIANFSLGLPDREVILRLDADPGRISGSELHALAELYRYALRALASGRGVPAAPASWLTREESTRMLASGDGRPAPLPDRTLARQFRDIAVARPAELAFTGPEPVTFGDLAAEAGSLALLLAAHQVGPGDVVGVCLPRSSRQIAAMIAVLDREAVVLPLDPAHPAARLRQVLSRAGAKAVFVAPASAGGPAPDPGAPDLGVPDLGVPDLGVPAIPATPGMAGMAAAGMAAGTRQAGRGPAAPAFLLPTSGSTGEPKHVLLTHAAVGNRLAWMWRWFPFAADDVVAYKTSPAFVDFIGEAFGALLRGIPLAAISDADCQDPRRLAAALRDHRATRLVLVPTLLRALLDAVPGLGRELPALRSCTTSGEPLPPDLALRFRRAAPGVRLLNLYGSTEVAGDVTAADLTAPEPGEAAAVTVGRPIDNAAIAVLDAGLRPVPPGAPGQVYAIGANLAWGYHADPALTAERFLPCPRPAAFGERMYATGDIGRWRPDGQLELTGRAGRVAKVRGQRIDVAELERALLLLPGVSAAAAAVRQRAGQDVLVAYLAGSSPGLAEARSCLRSTIPAGWLPDALVCLPELPRTASGKLDRAALPAPPGQEPPAAPRVPARTPTQRLIAAIWQEVLGLDEAGIYDDFFDLGGNSVLAMQAAMRVEAACGRELEVAQLFRTPTVAELAAYLEALEKTPGSGRSLPVAAYPDGRAPLSHTQERLWFLDQLEPGSSAYVIPVLLRLEGALDTAAIDAALRYVAGRHEALRTTFGSRGGVPFQEVADGAALTVERAGVAGRDADQREAAAVELAREFGRRPFDLATGPVARALLITVSAQVSLLALSVHHIAADGWSLSVIARELLTAYEAAAQGTEPGLPPPPVQFPGYAAWQRAERGSSGMEARLGRLAAELTPLPAPLRLPADYPPPARRTYAGAAVTRRLGAEATTAVRRLGSGYGCTTFMVMLAGFVALLRRYCDETDIAVGTPVASRPGPALAEAVGFFANTMVLRVDASGRPTFTELLRRVKDVAVRAHDDQDVPFELLVERLQPARDLGGNPLFSVMFELQDGRPGLPPVTGLTVTQVPLDYGIAKFDLTMHIEEERDDLLIYLEYSTELFARRTAERIADHYLRGMLAAADRPDSVIEELPLATGTGAGVAAGPPDPPDQGFLAALAAHAGAHGDDVAGREDGGAVSYRELAWQARRIAGELRRHGTRRGDIVAVHMRRGTAMLAAVAGILAAGAAYLPVDAAEPPDRARRLLAGAGPAAIVTDPAHAAQAARVASGLARPPSVLVAQDVLARADGPAAAFHAAGPEELAYVLYTSGSTGEPKAVMVSHRGFLGHIRAMAHALGLGRGTTIGQTASACFDISVWQMLAPLAFGGTTRFIGDDSARDPAALCEILAAERIDVVEVVPSVLAALTAWAERAGLRPLGTRWMLVTGEVVPAGTARRWRELAPDSTVVNAYGPAECADDVALHIARDIPGDLRRLPVGWPVAGTALHIVDRELRLVPEGAIGELAVAGDPVGLGYLGSPAATAASFVPDPFTGRPGGRLYLTGDLARRLPDGAVDVIGRRDDQVKVRGARVELAEVQAAMAAVAGVHAAAVTIRDGILAGYFEGTAEPPAVRRQLQRTLPAHMVPSSVARLQALPRTPTGKLDRHRLPAPSPGPAGLPAGPATEEEGLLLGIWADVLGRDGFGIDDDFFDLGGQSLLAVQVQARIWDRFGLRLPLRRLFEAPTVRELAAAVVDEQIAQSPQDEVARALTELRSARADDQASA